MTGLKRVRTSSAEESGGGLRQWWIPEARGRAQRVLEEANAHVSRPAQAHRG